jgi:hypothetical protein
MTVTTPLWFIVPIGLLGFGFIMGKLEGRQDGFREERANHCEHGETRPCVFGPGIVGIQICTYYPSWKDTTCNPDPAYRIPAKPSAP